MKSKKYKLFSNIKINININIKMDYFCNVCNYTTNIKCNFDKHNNSKKHTEMSELTNKYVCEYCHSKIKHQSNYSRHIKICKTKRDDLNIVLELEKIKHTVEIQDLKIKNQDLQIKNQDLKIKHLEGKNGTVQTINITTNNIDSNNNNNTITNISKIDNLNQNYGNVIDIETFIKNFETEKKYGLTEKDSETLLYICKNGTIETITNSFMFYMKESMRKQYQDIFNVSIPIDNTVMPYITGDMSFRYHFEKFIDKGWCKTTSNNNIKKLLCLTEKQVYEHQKEPIILSGYQKRRVINSIIKESTLDKDTDLYKS
jgi:hypothetical protein